MKEIVIISGKGGTGKTSLTGAFASLADNAVLADCDVDAADLHLLLTPDQKQQTPFYSGHEAVIDPQKCIGCGRCREECRFDAIQQAQNGSYEVKLRSCEGCGLCVELCPAEAISFPESLCGSWFQSSTRFGTMIHAELKIGAENSGKLVHVVRNEAKKAAESSNADLILTDGPPGIGCPVIAAITDADAVVIVTEPTLSGQHDLERVLKLVKHFDMPAFICINKWDINPEIADAIEQLAGNGNATFLGKLPYNLDFTQAQLQQKCVTELPDSSSGQMIRSIWDILSTNIKNL